MYTFFSSNLYFKPLLIYAGDTEQAEGFHRRALRARESAHGPDHPDMPVLLSNLAGTLYIQVDTEKAQEV
ncbi:unnamed protein product, partial [Laminaria digitata]